MRLIVFALFLAVVLVSCAKKPPVEVAFKPVQVDWHAQTEADEALPNKDACVIRVTSALMQDSVIQASALEEIQYKGVYTKGEGAILSLKGACVDENQKDLPECNWSASCDCEKVVVNVHNEP